MNFDLFCNLRKYFCSLELREILTSQVYENMRIKVSRIFGLDFKHREIIYKNFVGTLPIIHGQKVAEQDAVP